MIQRRDRFRLLDEALSRASGIGTGQSRAFAKKLEGDETIQVAVASPVDHTHTTATDFVDDLEMGDRFADQLRPPSMRNQVGGILAHLPMPGRTLSLEELGPWSRAPGRALAAIPEPTRRL